MAPRVSRARNKGPVVVASSRACLELGSALGSRFFRGFGALCLGIRVCGLEDCGVGFSDSGLGVRKV